MQLRKLLTTILAAMLALAPAAVVGQTQPVPSAKMPSGPPQTSVPTAILVAPVGGVSGPGRVVAIDQGLPVQGIDSGTSLPCTVGVSVSCVMPTTGGGGGGGGAVYGPTAQGSPAANPPVLVGGTVDGTDTGDVQVLKVGADGGAAVTATNAFALESTLQSVDASLAAIAAAVGSPIPAGTDTIGNVRIVGNTTGGNSVSSAIVANNTTSVAIKASAGTLYAIRVFNNSATIAYLKLYDAAQGSTTCGSGTPKMRILIPANTSGAGAVFPVGGAAGVAFATAITRCVTTGMADNDTGAPAATTYILEADYN